MLDKLINSKPVDKLLHLVERLTGWVVIKPRYTDDPHTIAPVDAYLSRYE